MSVRIQFAFGNYRVDENKRALRAPDFFAKYQKLYNSNGEIWVGGTSKYANPFLLDVDGDAEECRDFYAAMMANVVVPDTTVSEADQRRYRQIVADHLPDLRGKNLLCSCPIGRPCHADVLLKFVAEEVD